jgi:hypothetical protein
MDDLWLLIYGLDVTFQVKIIPDVFKVAWWLRS